MPAASPRACELVKIFSIGTIARNVDLDQSPQNLGHLAVFVRWQGCRIGPPALPRPHEIP
jgi:hypothetical protein